MNHIQNSWAFEISQLNGLKTLFYLTLEVLFWNDSSAEYEYINVGACGNQKGAWVPLGAEDNICELPSVGAGI